MLVVIPFRSIIRRPTAHLSVPPNETSFCPLERDVLVPSKGQEEKRTRRPAAAKRILLFFLADPGLAPVFKTTWASHKWAAPSVLNVFDITSSSDMMSWLAI